VSDEYHIGRHVANLHVVSTYEGQSDIHGLNLRSRGHWIAGLLLAVGKRNASHLEHNMSGRGDVDYCSLSHKILRIR
jgi:hypothetical protein